MLRIQRNFTHSRACRPAVHRVKLRHAMPDATIHTVATILENLNPVLYRVRAQNGKTILAHLSKPLTEEKAEFAVDSQVVIELTPFDFDQARILGLAE